MVNKHYWAHYWHNNKVSVTEPQKFGHNIFIQIWETSWIFKKTLLFCFVGKGLKFYLKCNLGFWNLWFLSADTHVLLLLLQFQFAKSKTLLVKVFYHYNLTGKIFTGKIFTGKILTGTILTSKIFSGKSFNGKTSFPVQSLLVKHFYQYNLY